MPSFDYTAADRFGKKQSGVLVAEGRAAAMKDILGRGLRPVSLEERGGVRSVEPKVHVRLRGVSRASVEAFTRELANLLAAGVPLSRALLILSREASQGAARQRWVTIHDDVVGGMTLADALAKWPRSFPPVYVAMVRAGEAGGFLALVLEQIADFRSREQELKSKVKAALVYPIVLATLAVLVLTFLLTYFIPRFSTLFAEFGGALPWLTRAIVATSNFMLKYGLLIVAALVLAGLALRRLTMSYEGRRTRDRLILKIPAVGGLAARFALVRFCRILGTLLGAGVALVPALRVAREAVGNESLADVIGRAVDDVQRGASLSKSLAASQQLIPTAVVEMVAVAEESGRLDKELVRVAGAYEARLDRRLRMLVALAEPALLFLMAGIVGAVVIGMLLPVFTLQDLIR
ncbi:MAG: type II secretion system F family protein [Planctomycetota bacterium]|jgi:type II secretory pathway component PulF